MSILTRPLGGKKGGAEIEQVAAPKKGGAPVLATSPRADLLPPEIGLAIKGRAVQRGLKIVIVASVVIAGLATAGAWQLSVHDQNQLAAAQQQTQTLTAEKGKYAAVVKAVNGIALGKAAVKVGGSTDIDWAAYLNELQATLPKGVVLTQVTIKSADVVSTYAQSTVPLEGSRIATLTFTATSPTLPSIQQWVDGLSTLPGFADASPDSVASLDSGGFTAQVTMHINTGAYSHRFDGKGGSK